MIVVLLYVFLILSAPRLAPFHSGLLLNNAKKWLFDKKTKRISGFEIKPKSNEINHAKAISLKYWRV